MDSGSASPKTPIFKLYEKDFHTWARKQVYLLRHRQWEHIDLENLIEEIESLGKQQQRELRERLSVLISQLLKWEYQPLYRTRSWLAAIRVERRRILHILKENPSLQLSFEDLLAEAYRNGRDLAMGETNLSDRTFPAACPYTWENIIAEDFYPGEPDNLA